ncbi:MAG: hypothetical protein AB7G40_11555 [Hyphomonadaceae bacterium]
MTERTISHEAIAWTKHRLDDLEIILFEVEKAADDLQSKARDDARRTAARLRELQQNLLVLAGDLRAAADDTRRDATVVGDALEAEWIEVESTLQGFLTGAKEQSEVIRGVIVARARAQQRAWGDAFKALRQQTNDAVEKARDDYDSALKRLSDEADAFQARLGQVKEANDASWTAVQQALAEAKSVNANAIQKIKQAFAKAF